MGERDIERIFERLDIISQRLATIEANQASAANTAADTGEKLDAIRVNGCVMGRDHERRLTQIEGRPERSINIGAAAVAIVSAIVAWFKGS